MDLSSPGNKLVDDASLSFDDYLANFDVKVQQAARLIPTPEADDANLRWVREAAPNAIQWTVGKTYLNNASTYKYYRQYQLIRDFFELRCPVCNPMEPEAIDCWGKTQMYLEGEVLLEWNMAEQDDVCPKCKTTHREFAADGLFKNYNQFHAVVGMRGGKTATASIIGTYIEHRVTNIHYSTPGGISAYFQQLPNQHFEITFIAATDVQSQDTIWSHFLARRKMSPWIQRYINWIKEVEKTMPKLSGVKPIEYRELDKEIDNQHMNVVYNSMNSNSSGMAGRTRIGAFLDELSRFQNTESAKSADEAYRVLENSLETTRAMVDALKLIPFFGSMISITSPISVDDKAMRLLKQSPYLKRMYACHYPTWEFNPYQPRSRFDDQFTKDPLGARRDFGADPPSAANPLIDDKDHFRKQTIDMNLRPTAIFDYYTKTDSVGNQYKATRVLSAELALDSERYIVFDAGLTFDTFAGACAHGEWWDTPDKDDTGKPKQAFVTVFDWIMRILPQKHPVRMEVWFDSILDVVESVRKKQRVGKIEFDRWNSATLVQNIRDKGVAVEHRPSVVQDYVKFVADANIGRIRLLKPAPDDDYLEPHTISPEGTVFYEMERLERSPDLRKIFNPYKGQRIGWNSDDVAQCVVHAHKLVQDTVGIDQSQAARSVEMRLRNEQIGSAKWGRQKNGRIYHPAPLASNRRW